ncbi:MAG TPA: aminomethyl transferase family protein [Allosphingosinicella sp.]|nr:aminomethyl transferase family protein [Allosphingosinicella sp.]
MATSPASSKSLEDAIRDAGTAIDMLRKNPQRSFVFPNVPPEFTNWQEEQRAFRETVALSDMSHHMTELHLRGPDAVPFVKRFALNKLDPFPTSRGKQMVAVAPDGNMIGDAIMFREAEDFLRVVGAPSAIDWLQFQSQRDSYDMTAAIEHSSAIVPGPRDVFRLQIQGPNALGLMNEVSGGTMPDIKFFHIGDAVIAGHPVKVLRHSMSGHAGFEIFGPWDGKEPVREALIEVGAKYGLRLAGMRGGPVITIEGGWLPNPLPAIYSGEEMAPFRLWLTSSSFEAVASLGGSFGSRDVTEYYTDPFEAGYGQLIDFNRDFVGRDALLERQKSQRRKKVTLVWNNDDILAVFRSVLTGQNRGRLPEIPFATFATFITDRVERNGRLVGQSRHQYGYSANVNAFISLAIVDIESSKPGTEVKVLWGEYDRLSQTVPEHEIHEIRATVAPSPYYESHNKTGS